MFCHSYLGKNDVLSFFSVGARLAFDPLKGRLWAVCAECGRWNLAPIEDRWEAVEECERLFSVVQGTMGGENVGVGFLPDGTSLIRIGNANRTEFAEWRFGNAFVSRALRSHWRAIAYRRKMKRIVFEAATIGVSGAVAAVGLAAGNLAIATIALPLGAFRLHKYLREQRKIVALVTTDDGWPATVQRSQLGKAEIFATGSDIGLRIPLVGEDVLLTGQDAIWAFNLWLPRLNSAGAGKSTVRYAAEMVEADGSYRVFFERMGRSRLQLPNNQLPLSKEPAVLRLAIEMAANGHIEGQYAAGDLLRLQVAWREAEEIAAISDSLMVPTSSEVFLVTHGVSYRSMNQHQRASTKRLREG